MIEETGLERVFALYQAMPEFSERLELDGMRERLGDNYLPLVYSVGGVDAGFKLGYALDEQEFYSWLGGVLPDYRGRGIAQALMERQEAWAADRGFRILRVKSMNRYPAMLSLLINNGYVIDGIEGDDPASSKIHFFKSLGGST